MKAGEIGLAALSQVDGRKKFRPVLLLSELPGYRDWLVAGVSSQVGKIVPNWDELLQSDDADFQKTGLKTASIIRLSFLSSIPEESLAGSIGSIIGNRLKSLKTRLAKLLLEGLR